MKPLLFILFLFAATAVGAQTTYTCGTTTQAGTACSRKVNNAGIKCWQHGGQTKAQQAGTTTTTTTCGATTKAGTPCKNRVSGGGKCHLHKG